MILETMTPLDFMDFRLVSKYLITGYKNMDVRYKKVLFNVCWLLSEIRGNLHAEFFILFIDKNCQLNKNN